MTESTATYSLKNLTYHWNRLINQSTNRKIFGAALIVALCSVAVKALGMFKELVVAYSYGTSDAMDAYLIAYILPSFTVSIVTSSFNAAVIPAYIQERDHKSPEAAQELAGSMLTLCIGFLLLMTLVMALCSPLVLPFFGSGFGAEKLALTQKLFYFLLPVIILNGLATIFSSILNAGENFTLVALSPLLISITIIVSLVGFAPALGIYALVLGVLAGFASQGLLLAWGLKKKNVKLRPRWAGLTPPIRNAIKQYFPILGGSMIMVSTDLVDQSMAAMLEAGSVAALGYGNRIPSAVLAIGAMGLGTAALPYFSKMAAGKDWEGIADTLKKYSLLILQISIPVTLLLMYFSESLIRLLFERGAFTDRDTLVVGQIQAMYALQIPFYILSIMKVRLISSLKYNQLLFYGTLISFPLNIVLNYTFMQFMGVSGIALSTACVYLVSNMFLSVGLKRKMKRLTAGTQ